jgi:uncharacterized Rmd1/YagE family protein
VSDPSENTPPDGSGRARQRRFVAHAFAENLPLKELAPALPEARRTPHELIWPVSGGGEAFLFPFGVVVFFDVEDGARERELRRLASARPVLTPSSQDDLMVRESPSEPPGAHSGVLVVDHLTPQRSGLIALTIAQSVAMDYYEGIVDQMLERTAVWVERLERRGTVPYRIRALHRFIGEAVSTRSEVLAVLHLLDKPDAAWEDAAMEAIYEDLRDEFDLADRHVALEHKLRSVQEALELVLDVARDRRLVILEVAIVVLIVLEIVLGLVRVH